MMNDRTLTAAPQASNTQALLDAYRQYTGDNTVTANSLFDFFSTPTPEREEFLLTCCTCTYSSTANIVIPTYTAL